MMSRMNQSISSSDTTVESMKNDVSLSVVTPHALETKDDSHGKYNDDLYDDYLTKVKK